MVKDTYRKALLSLVKKYEQAEIWDRKYIRAQLAQALRLWRRGLRPGAEASDMACTFWCELPELKPYWDVRFEKTEGWQGRIDPPLITVDKCRCSSEDVAAAYAHWCSTNARFGGLNYACIPVRTHAWGVYNSFARRCLLDA